jgi:hypothetical protein
MELTMDQLKKLSIKQLKAILKQLEKDDKGLPETDVQIKIIKGIIDYKKKTGLITHPAFVKNGETMIREKRCVPVHLADW